MEAKDWLTLGSCLQGGDRRRRERDEQRLAIAGLVGGSLVLVNIHRQSRGFRM